MRHGQYGRKFNRTRSQRNALLINLATSLLQYEQIKTTLPKAKDLRPFTEKLITLGKKGGLHRRRQALSALRNNTNIVNKLMDRLGARYQERPGGYIRIIKAGFRKGDRAPMAIIELVDRDLTAKPSKPVDTASEATE